MMKWIRTLGFVAGLSLGFGTVAYGMNVETVRAHMKAGDYISAYDAADRLNTADGQALAAEVLLSEIMLGQARKNKKQAKRARKLAKGGLELDPTHQNARLQYAIADGFVTRETGDVSAWMKKLPQKTEVIVQAYRTDFPEDPRGDALLGAWHLAIARKAGNKNAEKWFGASIDQGQVLFGAARESEPDDIIIAVNYAFSLLALKEEDFPDIDEAREILTVVMGAQPTDHLGQVLQTYAKEALIQIDNRDVIRDYTGMFLDGKVPNFIEDN